VGHRQRALPGLRRFHISLDSRHGDAGGIANLDPDAARAIEAKTEAEEIEIASKEFKVAPLLQAG
jgi:hypothetical protein